MRHLIGFLLPLLTLGCADQLKPLALQKESAEEIKQKEAKRKRIKEEAIRAASVFGIKLVEIPAGKFVMGSPEGEGGNSREFEDPVTVSIEEPFLMAATEVTQKQWFAVMKTKPWKKITIGQVAEGDDLPAVGMTGFEAKTFCEFLSTKTIQKFRLPTEAEWEYACRSNSQKAFCYGDDENQLVDYAWHHANCQVRVESFAHQVGLLKPNKFGLFDMHGNVNEWTDGLFRPDYIGRGVYRNHYAQKGGSWGVYARFCRSAVRSPVEKDDRSIFTGFRPVCSLNGIMGEN